MISLIEWILTFSMFIIALRFGQNYPYEILLLLTSKAVTCTVPHSQKCAILLEFIR